METLLVPTSVSFFQPLKVVDDLSLPTNLNLRCLALLFFQGFPFVPSHRFTTTTVFLIVLTSFNRPSPPGYHRDRSPGTSMSVFRVDSCPRRKSTRLSTNPGSYPVHRKVQSTLVCPGNWVNFLDPTPLLTHFGRPLYSPDFYTPFLKSLPRNPRRLRTE